MFKVDYTRGRDGNEDFVTKCNNDGILVVNRDAKCGSVVDAWRVCSMVVVVHNVQAMHQGYVMYGHSYMVH
ncbi:unnamed protein product, partial [Sphagnum tenellum]